MKENLFFVLPTFPNQLELWQIYLGEHLEIRPDAGFSRV